MVPQFRPVHPSSLNQLSFHAVEDDQATGFGLKPERASQADHTLHYDQARLGPDQAVYNIDGIRYQNVLL